MVKQQYLGLISDNRLTWTNHISNIYKKCHTIHIWLACTGTFFLTKLFMGSIFLPTVFAVPVKISELCSALNISLHRFDHTSETVKQLQWFNMDQLIHVCLICVMLHQYHRSKGILLLLLIEFGSHRYTLPYVATRT